MIEVADLVASLRGSDDGFTRLMDVAGRGVEGLHRHTGSALKSVEDLGKGLGALSAGGLAMAVKSAADFQSATQALANNTNMTAGDLDQMRQASLRLSAATGQSADAIAEGWMHIANHAYAGAAAMNIATAATENAAATGGSAAEDMNVLSGVLREYNVQADALAKNNGLATRWFDVLHNAVANSNFTMNDFVEGSKRAIATAGAFGVPISQVTAQLAVLSEHGFPTAHVAAQNWAGMLRSLEAPNKKALAGFTALSKATGVDLLGDIKKLQRDGSFLPQFIKDIEKATGGDFNKVRLLMPQSSYATVLEGLVRNLPQLQAIQAKTDAALQGRRVPGMTGTVEAFQAEQRTLAGQLADLRQSFNVTAISIGTALLPPLTQLATAIRPVAQGLADWAGKHQQLTAGILAAGAALGGLATAATALGPALAIATGPVGLLAAAGVGLYEAWSHNLGGIQGIVKGAWSQVRPVFSAMQAAVGTLEKAFQAGGVGGAFKAVPSALAPVGAALGDLGGKIKAALGGVDWAGTARRIAQGALAWGEAFVGWVKPNIPRLVTAAEGLGQSVLTLVERAAPIIGRQLLAWGQQFVAWVVPATVRFLQAWPGMLNGFLDALAKSAGPIADQLGAWADEFVAWARKNDVLGKLGTALLAVNGAIVAFIVETAATIGTKLVDWGGKFVEWVGPRIQPMLRELGNLLGQLGTWITGPAAKAVGDKLKDWAAAFGTWVLGTAWPTLQQEVPKLLTKLSAWITGPARKAVQDNLGHWAGAFWGWVQDVWPKLTAQVGALLGQLTGWILNTAAPAIRTQLGHWAGAFWGWAQEALPKLPGELEKIAAKVLTWVYDDARPRIVSQLGHWAGAFWGWVQDVWPQLRTKLQGLLGDITHWVTHDMADAIKTAAAGVGHDMIQGVKDGVTGMAGGFKNHLVGVFSGGFDAVRHFHDSHSPSLLYFRVGVDMIQGAINGILSKAGEFTGVTVGVFKQAVESAQAYVGAGVVAIVDTFTGAIVRGFGGRVREGTIAAVQDWAGVLLPAAEAGLVDSEARGAPLAQAIQQVHKQALAAATPSVTAQHHALGQAAAAAIASGMRAGKDGIVAAVNDLVTASTKAAQQLTANFAQVAAEAAQRMKNILATGGISGVTAGTLAPVTQTVDQQSIAPSVSAGFANQARGNFAQVNQQAQDYLNAQQAANIIAQTFGFSAAPIGNSPLQQAIVDAMKIAPDAFKTQGKLMASLLAAGLAQGLGEQGAITYALRTLSQGMQGQFTQDWQIQSPSRVMHRHGQAIAEGLANGILAGKERVASAFRSLGSPGALPGNVLPFVPPAGVGAGAAAAPTIHITIANGAVQVSGGGLGHDDMARALAEGLADYTKQFIQAQRQVVPPARPTLAGAQRVQSVG